MSFTAHRDDLLHHATKTAEGSPDPTLGPPCPPGYPVLDTREDTGGFTEFDRLYVCRDQSSGRVIPVEHCYTDVDTYGGTEYCVSFTAYDDHLFYHAIVIAD